MAADQLATPEDLASALQQDLDLATATLWVEVATAVVQGATGGQRIVQVIDDTFEIMGLAGSWLDLPQIPVTAVSAVAIDGEDITGCWKKFGDRLWRRHGWQRNLGQWWGAYPPQSFDGRRYEYCVPEPSAVTGTYTHGYAEGAQELQLARGAVIGLCQDAYPNPTRVKSESIDDYSAVYAAVSAAMEASPNLAASLRRQYGRKAGFARIG